MHVQAVMHYGEAFKALMNEEIGDGNALLWQSAPWLSA